MKILIIQERGRNEGNRHFRECYSFQQGFNKLGIDTVIWGLGFDNFNVPFDSIVTDCDVILLLENYEFGHWIPNLSSYKNKLKLFWCVDSHVVLNQHLELCKKHKIDIVLNAIESDRIHFENIGCKTVYFPNAYNNNLVKYKPEIQKIYDVGFCGNILNRGEWINAIPNIKTDVMVIGDNMVNVINSYKIHFNRNISKDINFRTFETLGCNTFLLTNETESLNKLFDIGKHLVTYSTKEDMNEKIQYYLNHENERNNIVLEGYNHVQQFHTYEKRCETILKIIS